eukprot:c13072_g1_i1.p1 GENE.c13072_g1_i1~~c13072_g1_i1.p1  ORF type:complete len:384 (+),score=64.80 c13072_g1_i1:87-1154(+)
MDVAAKLRGAIICADSVQMYRELKIGANAPTPGMFAQVPHLLFQSLPLTTRFSAADYVRAATAAINSLPDNTVPILVGGSGLYLQFLVEGIPVVPQSDLNRRLRIEQELRDVGWFAGLARLRALDPERASNLHDNDFFRLSRAIEILEGEKLSSPLSSKLPAIHKINNHKYAWTCFNLTMNREALCKSLDARCEAMIHQGLLEEVWRIFINDPQMLQTSAARAIGYAQSIAYLQRDPMLESPRQFLEYLEEMQVSTRQYAKRQVTWFKKKQYFENLNVTTTSSEDAAQRIISAFEQNTESEPQEFEDHQQKPLLGRQKKLLPNTRLTIFTSQSKIVSFLSATRLRITSMISNKLP